MTAAVQIVHHPEIAVICPGDAIERLAEIIDSTFEVGQRAQKIALLEALLDHPIQPPDFDDPSQDQLRAEEREAADDDRRWARGEFF